PAVRQGDGRSRRRPVPRRPGQAARLAGGAVRGAETAPAAGRELGKRQQRVHGINSGTGDGLRHPGTELLRAAAEMTTLKGRPPRRSRAALVISETSMSLSSTAANTSDDGPKSAGARALAAVPVVLTVLATILAGLSSSE